MPAEQPDALQAPLTGDSVEPPQLPRHCHVPPERSRFVPAEQPDALHTPFTDGRAAQLALVALPQFPPQLHGNVAEPVRQEAVFDAFALLPPEVALTGPEQLVPPLLQPSVAAEQLDVQGRVSVGSGLVDSSQAAPPQPGWTQVTVRVRLSLQLPPDSRQELHALQAPLCQTPSLGALPVQVRDDGPVQVAPPQAGDGLLQVRVCLPLAPQAVAEQALHVDQPPLTGELPVQARVSLVPRLPSSFRHAWPPCAGDGSLQVRVCVPLAPQAVAEQVLHADQPPSTAGFAREQVPEFEPPLVPSQRHRWWLVVSATAASLAVPALQPFLALSSHTPATGTSSMRMKHLSEFRPPCWPSQRQR